MHDFQHGDPEGFAELYRKYKKPIHAYLSRQFSTLDNPAELTQEVFLRAIRSAAGFRHGARFTTWVFSIARNLGIDSVRKARHRNHRSLDQKMDGEGPSLGERVANAGPSPDRAATQSRLRDDLSRAIERLPHEQREVFLLREYHGFAFREISELVGAKEGTVKSRMRYALEALQRDLEHYSDYAKTLK